MEKKQSFDESQNQNHILSPNDMSISSEISIVNDSCIYCLLEVIDGSYEVTDEAYTLLNSFKNKRVSIAYVIGNIKYEVSSVICEKNSIIIKSFFKNEGEDTMSIDNKIFFTFNENKDSSITIVLFVRNELDLNLRLLCFLLSSNVVYCLENNYSEDEVVQKLDIFKIFELQEIITNNTNENNNLNSDYEDIYPPIIFIVDSMPLFKSEVSNN
jgi:hypothetical protein